VLVKEIATVTEIVTASYISYSNKDFVYTVTY